MIKNLLEAEQALQKLIAIESEQQRIQSICRKKTRPWYEKISRTLLRIQQKEERLIEEALNLHIQLEHFAQVHRKTWPKKSLKLTHGTIGFREKVKVIISQKTAQLLLDLGYSDYVRIRRDVNREKMLELDENILNKADAQKVIEDQFYVSTMKNGG